MQLGDGRELPSAVTIWTAGFVVPDLAARRLSTDALGRLLTDETLTSVDDVRIVAAGDSAAPSDLPYRMSCRRGQPGLQAAETVLSRVAVSSSRPSTWGSLVSASAWGVCRHLPGRPQQRRRNTALPRRPTRREAQGAHLQAHRGSSWRRRRVPGSRYQEDEAPLLQAKRGEAPATGQPSEAFVVGPVD